MSRDIITLVTMGILSVVVVLGYQNFDRATQVMGPAMLGCNYSKDFVKLADLKEFTPIVYTLENRQVWKGQSGGAFQKISPDKESIINFKIVETGKVQALSESQPMEYSLLESKDSGETWMIVGNISELDLNATLFDAVEYKGKVLAALKFLNGPKSFLRLVEKELTAATWKKLREFEIENDTVASFGKDLGGNLYFAYTSQNKIVVEKKTPQSDFSSLNSYEVRAPFAIVPSSFMGTVVDSHGALRVFVNVKSPEKTGSLVVTFAENKDPQVQELTDNGAVTTSMAVSEDGTISLNGIKKAPGALAPSLTARAAEAFLKINACLR